MDFWARLIGAAGSRTRSAAPNPQQRLARFKKVYGQILATSHSYPSILTDTLASENLETYFQRLASNLHEEFRSPAPHLCTSFAASAKIYTPVSRIASSSDHEGVIHSAIGLFSALLESEEEDFAATKEFAEALTAFTTSVVGSGKIGENTETDLVELLFSISAKIRLQPEVLPVWFTSSSAKRRGSPTTLKSGHAAFAGITQKGDFPLCYQLIDYVHHDGRIGDFARTGLLYIFESAVRSQTLEEWLVESDLPTLMASGLGALYSQLSRKLSILHPKADMPFILSLSDFEELPHTSEAENLFAPHFQIHMDTFLSYLVFWQDVLEHCRSVDVRSTLTDHFRVLFLQQLLYPSLLESSDADGGSSVAVLTYLRRILDTLDHPELIQMILQYLLAMPEARSPPSSAMTSPSKLRRRMSLMLLSASTIEDDQPDPNLFSLIDLIHSGIQSHNSQTVTSALKLTTILFSKNHSYVVGTLLRVQSISPEDPPRTHGALNMELEQYISIAEYLGGSTGLDSAYEGLLKDVMYRLETHGCSATVLALSDLGLPTDIRQKVDSFMSDSTSIAPHRIASNDKLSSFILDVLKNFLTNKVDTNLSLTEMIVTLASCPYLRLEGWLVVDPSKYGLTQPESQSEPGSDTLDAISMARRRPNVSDDDLPTVLRALQLLQSQIVELKKIVPDLDRLIEARKQAFLINEQIEEATRVATQRAIASRTSSEKRRTSLEQTGVSFSGRINKLPAHIVGRSDQSSRSESPTGRGVQSNFGTSPAPTSSPGGMRLSSSPRPSGRIPLHGRTQSLTAADIEAAQGQILQKRVRLGSISQSSQSEEGREVEDAEAESKVVTLNHILTNLVILQEFVLELAAIVQVRATLFQEVKFG